MPTFRGTLTLEEAGAMARYLRSFVPGTEVPRPDVGRAGPTTAARSATVSSSPAPATAPAPTLPPLPPQAISRSPFTHEGLGTPR